jgi:hypothetical protein
MNNKCQISIYLVAAAIIILLVLLIVSNRYSLEKGKQDIQRKDVQDKIIVKENIDRFMDRCIEQSFSEAEVHTGYEGCNRNLHEFALEEPTVPLSYIRNVSLKVSWKDCEYSFSQNFLSYLYLCIDEDEQFGFNYNISEMTADVERAGESLIVEVHMPLRSDTYDIFLEEGVWKEMRRTELIPLYENYDYFISEYEKKCGYSFDTFEQISDNGIYLLEYDMSDTKIIDLIYLDEDGAENMRFRFAIEGKICNED